LLGNRNGQCMLQNLVGFSIHLGAICILQVSNLQLNKETHACAYIEILLWNIKLEVYLVDEMILFVFYVSNWRMWGSATNQTLGDPTQCTVFAATWFISGCHDICPAVPNTLIIASQESINTSPIYCINATPSASSTVTKQQWVFLHSCLYKSYISLFEAATTTRSGRQQEALLFSIIATASCRA
jgi:hypothetical protein